MKKIEVKILNPEAVQQAEQMMVFTARLTQRGEGIHSMDDLMALYEKPFTHATLNCMVLLPHPTIQKFGVINVAVVGASRRFLAQIIRHQNEVKFMSASLQYSDYTGQASFAVPYEIMQQGRDKIDAYIASCEQSLANYSCGIEQGLDHDEASYMLPQGLRNILIISATPYQWKHMISQRVCRRNTSETRIVMLKIWSELFSLSPYLFSVNTAGPFCLREGCKEGKMSCGKPLPLYTPDALLRKDYPLLFKEER